MFMNQPSSYLFITFVYALICLAIVVVCDTVLIDEIIKDFVLEV